MMYLSQPSFWQKRPRALPIFLMLALCLFSTSIILFSTSKARAASITGSINWSATTGRSANLQYGLNAFHGYDPTPQMDPTYRSNVAAMKAGIVRWHYGSQMADSSTDSMAWVVSPTTSSYHWDTNKINSALSNALQSGGAFAYGPVKVMDIVNWPAYLDDGSEHLQSSQYSAYANFCAQLVRIININGHYGFKYFELFNERENGTGAPYDHNMAELGRIYNQAAAAMKAVDPTIKVGGPAFARPDLTYNIDDFFSTAAPNLDFVSYHSYATGNSSDTNQQVWDDADIGNFTTSIRAEYAKYSSRSIDYFHDEYNISWNPPDDKMTNEVGGVFDALAMTSLVNNGATGGMAWNEADGWYGKLDNSYARRPASYLYQYLNEDMKGNVVASSSSDSTKIVMLAVKNGNKDAFMLINRSGASQTIQLSFSGFSSAITNSTTVTTKQMSASGGNVSSTTIGALNSGSGYSMPADTVTVFSLTDAGGSGSTPTPTPSGGTTTSYEAEASVNTLSGGASVINCSTCSGGQRVGYLVAGASLRFNNISASSTGAATITIYYTNGNSSAMTTQVSANGGASVTVSYPSTGGWDTVGSVTVSLTLQAGSNNSILISNPSAAQPDIDRLTVTTSGSSSPTPTPTPAPTSTPTPTPTPGGPPVTYEAEASINTLSGGARVINCATCSGGQRVGYLVAGASLRFNNISTSSTGATTITIYYTNGNSSAMTTQVSANGGASVTVSYPSTGGWDTVGSVTVSLTLQAGSNNSILISNPSAAQPDIDRLTVQQ